MNEKIYSAKSKKKLNEKIQFLSFLGAVLSNPNYKTSTFTRPCRISSTSSGCCQGYNRSKEIKIAAYLYME